MSEFKELWPDGPIFSYSERGFALGMDSVLLSDFADRGNFSRAADLGCGTGFLLVSLLYNNPKLSAVGAEINKSAALSAEENIRANSFDDRCEIICSDLRNYKEIFAPGSFDLVLCNPPYFKKGCGYSASDEKTKIAREDLHLDLDEICFCASYICKNRGSFCMVMRTERLSETICTLNKYRFEPKRLRFIAKDEKTAPKLFLIEARLNAGVGLSVLPNLYLYDKNGEYSPEYRRVYHLEV